MDGRTAPTDRRSSLEAAVGVTQGARYDSRQVSCASPMAMDAVAQPKSSLTPASYQSMSSMGARNRMVSNYRYASLGYPVYYLMYIEEILQKRSTYHSWDEAYAQETSPPAPIALPPRCNHDGWRVLANYFIV